MRKAILGLVLVIAALLLTVKVMRRQLRHVNERWEVAASNMKAYDAQLAAEGCTNAALRLTVDQLESFRDSVLRELDATRRKLKVRDGELKALQSVSSSFSRTDTIVMPDTIFREPSLALDTLVGDEWYSLRLSLKYPSTIAARPYFRSEKHIVVSSRKETVNPPKRLFFLRWLQRKHRVLHIDVVEKNPYVGNESSRYVEIVK